MPKDNIKYGTKFCDMIYDLNHDLLGNPIYNTEKVRKNIEYNMYCMFEKDFSSHIHIDIEQNAFDSTTINVSINFNEILDSNILNMVNINPHYEKTHSWIITSQNNYKCTQCNIRKFEFNNIENNKKILMADENLSCNEFLVKNIIK